MRKIILCRGIPASGKSTWAKEWVLEDPENRVRFNNDDIRNMLGKYWVTSRENLLLEMKKDFMVSAMERGYDIVIDNMNLNLLEVDYYIELAKSTLGLVSPYVVEFKDFFDTPLEECIVRDAKRDNPIGEGVIRGIYEKYKSIIES